MTQTSPLPTSRPASMMAPRLSMMMFLQFFIWGAWYVTVGTFMVSRGMADGIPWAYTVGPLAAIISPFFLGIVADRFFATERMLCIMHLIGGAALLAAPFVADATPGSYWPFVGVLALHMLCYMPTLGLVNTLSFHHMSAPERQFPLIRVFGTVGWIVAGFAIARTAGLFGADASEGAIAAASPHFFYLAGGAGIVLGLYSLSLPHTPPPARGRRVSLRGIVGLDSLVLLKDRSFFIFIASSFLLCIPLAAYYAYAPVFVHDMGIENVPVVMTYGQMSEILFMLLMPLLFARLGVKWMLAVGMAAWAVRYGLFAGASGAADDYIRWFVLGGILLHGICYDFFFVAGFVYVDNKAPVEVRAQAQGFLVLITQGLGMFLGAQLAGRLVAEHTVADAPGATTALIDWESIWLTTGLGALVVLLLFVALFKAPRPEAPKPMLLDVDPPPST